MEQPRTGRRARGALHGDRRRLDAHLRVDRCRRGYLLGSGRRGGHTPRPPRGDQRGASARLRPGSRRRGRLLGIRCRRDWSTPGRYSAISVGGDRACAITDAGEAVCWGYRADEWGTPPPGPFTEISVGYSEFNERACALTGEGEVRCWAQFSSRQAPPGRYVAVAAGVTHACAISEAGEAVCWNTRSNGGSPYRPENALGGRYTAISASKHRTCAITDQGSLVCWGDANYEQWPLSGL